MEFNKVIIVGRLTKDPELRYTPAGTAVASFSIASNETYMAGTEKKKKTLFIDITVFGKTGENCSKYLAKGSEVLVEGKLDKNQWEKDGRKHEKTFINAREVKFMSKKIDKDAGSGPEGYGESAEETDFEPF